MTDPADFDLTDFLPYLLNRAAEGLSLDFQRHYKGRYGMLRTEWRVLFHLGRYGGMTATEVGARAGIHKTKISRAVHALEDKRFLTRNAHSDDRRQATLDLSARGRAAYDDLCGAAQAFDAEVEARLSPEEAAVLRRALRTLADL